MTAVAPVGPSPFPRNTLLSAFGVLPMPGRRVRLSAGDRLDVDGGTILFPVTAVVRVEVGEPRRLGGWIDRDGAVGLAEALAGRAIGVSWCVEVAGDAVVLPAGDVLGMLTTPAFGAAVMVWLGHSVEALRQDDLFNAGRSATERVVDLIERLAAYHRPQESFVMSQAEIARLTGIQRTTVCAIMVRLKKDRWMTGSRGRIRRLGQMPDARPRPKG